MKHCLFKWAGGIKTCTLPTSVMANLLNNLGKMKSLMARALLLQVPLLYHLSQCSITEEAYRMVTVANNQFCRLHSFSTTSRIECAAQCQLKEDNGVCTAYVYNAQQTDSCQCGQAPCFDSTIGTDVKPIAVQVNAKCGRFKEGKIDQRAQVVEMVLANSNHHSFFSGAKICPRVGWN